MKRPFCYVMLLMLCGVLKFSHGQNTTGPFGDFRDTLKQQILNTPNALADTASSRFAALDQLPIRYYSKVTSKTQHFNRRITKRTAKTLRRLQKQEKRIYTRLVKVDSLADHSGLAKSIDSLSQLRAMLKGKVGKITDKIPGKQYIPYCIRCIFCGL